MPALLEKFGFQDSWNSLYNDPAKYRLPQDMASYWKQDIGTYPGLECSADGLIESSNPLSAADLQIRPYDTFWADNLLFSDPLPGQQCTDLHITGEKRSQGCWSSDGTYTVSLATDKVMVMGMFTLYQANDRFPDLRDAVARDLARIAVQA